MICINHANLYNNIYNPSKYKMSWKSDFNRRVVMDSGSYSIRLGTAASPQPLYNYNNFIAIDRTTGNKIFGPQLDGLLDETKLIYQKSNVRGVTVKFQTYMSMLDDLMTKMQMPKKTTGFYCQDFTMTLPLLPFHPRKIMERYMEIYLQYYRFDAMYVEPSSVLIYDHARKLYNKDLNNTPFAISDRYAIVVESSQSATYITPFFEGKPILNSIKRLDVGGKLLTNYLKEILSFRHLDLKNSDRLIKQIKEDLCFVSRNLMEDMRCPKGTFKKHFILPDEQLKKKGYAVDVIDQSVYTQHISLDKERFQIPEIVFNPQDIGLQQKGLPDAILQTLKFAQPQIRHNYLENIIITGGNVRFPNFNERLYEQLKKSSSCWVNPMIYTMSNINACFEAAVQATKAKNFTQKLIIKDEYKQSGPNRITKVVFGGQ